MPRIMIVEDSREVRLVICEILKRKGYMTVEAENGLEALELLEQESRVDLIISDLRIDEAMQKGAVDYLIKPFTREQLLSVVEHHLIHAVS